MNLQISIQQEHSYKALEARDRGMAYVVMAVPLQGPDSFNSQVIILFRMYMNK